MVILDIPGISASSLSHNDKQCQISQLVHRIACEPDTRRLVKNFASLSREKAQVIMDYLQDVSGEKCILGLLSPPHSALKTLDEYRGREHPERGRVLSLLQDISDISDHVPKKLWLTGGVRNIRPHRTGGEADIDVGQYNGVKVACRSIRIEGYGDDPIEMRKASEPRAR